MVDKLPELLFAQQVWKVGHLDRASLPTCGYPDAVCSVNSARKYEPGSLLSFPDLSCAIGGVGISI